MEEQCCLAQELKFGGGRRLVSQFFGCGSWPQAERQAQAPEGALLEPRARGVCACAGLQLAREGREPLGCADVEPPAPPAPPPGSGLAAAAPRPLPGRTPGRNRSRLV